jgi:carboxylesterase type B
VLHNAHSFQELDLGVVFFRPTVEAENKLEEIFLPAAPIDLIKQGKFHKVPFLTGVNSSEGLLSLRGTVLVIPDA